jgi:hypothetical protein
VHQQELERWTAEVSSRMPHLGKLAAVLALYSFGMVLLKQSGLSVISEFISQLLEKKPNSVRQRLREWNYEASQKRGKQRQAIVVGESFEPLLRWMVSRWEGSELVLALDVTYLADRFTILAISVVYRGCAIPVAWRILAGNCKGEWHPVWVELLHTLRPAIPTRWTVWVLTDRGLYSKRLFEVICQLHWHPLMRVRTQGLYRRLRNNQWKSLLTLARPSMGLWAHQVVCFKGDPLVCTLLVQWDAWYNEPCLLITDGRPHTARPAVYAFRAWIEAGFKDLKRGGLRWEHTKMIHPHRVERLWLVMAVALLWLVLVGGEAQALHSLLADPSAPALFSCLTLGWLTLLVAALQHRPLPFGRFVPNYSAHKAPL